MADFTTGFWSAYIAILTALGIAFCLFVLVANSRKPPVSSDNTTGHVWDEDLREANNPLPRWWIGLFILTIVFAIGYLVFAEVPTRTTVIGAAIIIVAGILIIWRERQLGLERAREREAGRGGG